MTATTDAQTLPLPLEDLRFKPSQGTTLGVELEIQIVDKQTGDLVPGAVRILDGCAEEKIEGATGEFLLSMLEVKTGVCRDVAEVGESMKSTLRRVRNIASSLGYDLALGGTHPFGRACMSAVYPNERYHRITKRQGWMAYQEAVYGLHIHVGVPSGELAIGAVNLLTEYLPHLLALSANSPFWQGVDTGYASARARMFRPSPDTGTPPHFRTWDDFCNYCRVMNQAGIIAGTKDIYWDIRPRPQFGTIEFRICDAPPTLANLLALTALTRTLVVRALAMLDREPRLAAGDPRTFWLASQNRWLASRYGLKTECVRHPDGKRMTLGEDAAGLLDELMPIAKAAGEDVYLKTFDPPNRIETGADRHRRLFRQTGNWHAVLDDMKTRWLSELDDDNTPRPEATPPPTVAGESTPTVVSASDDDDSWHLRGPGLVA